MERALEFQIGSLIGGKYRLTRLLGEGGMGAVYAAEHTLLGKEVAIKLLQPELVKNREVIQRLHQEARTAAAVGLGGVGEVHDVGWTEEGAPYIVMELLRGESLADMLERCRKVEIGRAVELATQILSILIAVHAKQVVHRDLTPQNVFITLDDDGANQVKILDFGVSKMMSQGKAVSLTQPGAIIGTPSYMSPEMARGSKDVGQRGDIWAVGVVLYEMLAGRPPYIGENYNEVIAKILTEPVTDIRAWSPEVPEELERVVLKALAKTPDERYQRAADFLDALLPFRGLAISQEIPKTVLCASEPADLDLVATLPHVPQLDPNEVERAMATAPRAPLSDVNATRPGLWGQSPAARTVLGRIQRRKRFALRFGVIAVVIGVSIGLLAGAASLWWRSDGAATSHAEPMSRHAAQESAPAEADGSDEATGAPEKIETAERVVENVEPQPELETPVKAPTAPPIDEVRIEKRRREVAKVLRRLRPQLRKCVGRVDGRLLLRVQVEGDGTGTYVGGAPSSAAMTSCLNDVVGRAEYPAGDGPAVSVVFPLEPPQRPRPRETKAQPVPQKQPPPAPTKPAYRPEEW